MKVTKQKPQIPPAPASQPAKPAAPAPQPAKPAAPPPAAAPPAAEYRGPVTPGLSAADEAQRAFGQYRKRMATRAPKDVPQAGPSFEAVPLGASKKDLVIMRRSLPKAPAAERRTAKDEGGTPDLLVRHQGKNLLFEPVAAFEKKQAAEDVMKKVGSKVAKNFAIVGFDVEGRKVFGIFSQEHVKQLRQIQNWMAISDKEPGFKIEGE